MGDKATGRYPTLRSIVAVDVVGFGGRQNQAQLGVRRQLYRMLESAFRAAEIPWDRCAREDRGDGAMIVLPADTSVLPLLNPMPRYLAWLLDRHNQDRPDGDAERFALRMAIHIGNVHNDGQGQVGVAVNTTFRLLDSEPLRATLDGSTGAHLAVIVSDLVYQEIVPHGYDDIRPDSYHRVGIKVKETDTVGWIQQPEPAAPPPPPARPGRRRLLIGSAVAALVVLAAAGGLLTFSTSTRALLTGGTAGPATPTPPGTAVKFSTVTDPTALVAVHDGSCVTGNRDGDVYQMACNDHGSTYQWRLQQALSPSYKDPMYRFFDVTSGQCLTMITPYENGVPGSVGLRRCDDRSTDQLWHFLVLDHKNGWTYEKIVTFGDRYGCLDITGGSSADRTGAILWYNSPNKPLNQMFRVRHY